jgi:hypothetical protein
MVKASLMMIILRQSYMFIVQATEAIIKKSFGSSRSIDVMQQAVLIACIIFKYLHAIEEHFACCCFDHKAGDFVPGETFKSL